MSQLSFKIEAEPNESVESILPLDDLTYASNEDFLASIYRENENQNQIENDSNNKRNSKKRAVTCQSSKRQRLDQVDSAMNSASAIFSQSVLVNTSEFFEINYKLLKRSNF